MQLIKERASADEVEKMAQREGETLMQEMNRLISDFVMENFDNLLSIQIFSMYCQSFPQPTITHTIQEILNKAPDTFKENPFVKEYLRLANDEKKK